MLFLFSQKCICFADSVSGMRPAEKVDGGGDRETESGKKCLCERSHGIEGKGKSDAQLRN